MDENIGGLILSPPDERDYKISRVMEADIAIPNNFEVWQPSIGENQGSTGSCLAFTMANWFACRQHQISGQDMPHSVGWIYGNDLDYPRTSPGMVFRQGMDVGLKYGDINRDLFECFDEVPKVVHAFRGAYDTYKREALKPESYIRLESTEDIQRMLVKYKLPVHVGIDVKTVSPLNRGYHAVSVYGYRTSPGLVEFKINNSWGTSCDNIYIESDKILEAWGYVPNMPNFTDISGHWAEGNIRELAELGIMNGYPDGSFKPDQQVTRAELATALLKVVKRK